MEKLRLDVRLLSTRLSQHPPPNLILGLFIALLIGLSTQVHATDGLQATVVHAISDIPVLPNSSKLDRTGSQELDIVLARGEYEPASVVLWSPRKLDDVTVEISSLQDEQGGSTSLHIDTRIVKPWFQGWNAWNIIEYREEGRSLTPELLLYDDELVEVDYVARNNYLKLDGKRYLISSNTKTGGNQVISASDLPVSDAHTLRPFDIERSSNKQIWFTAHASDDARPGTYRGSVRFVLSGKIIAEVPLNVKVLGFDLSPPDIDYSIYYRGQLSKTGPTISSEFKSFDQMHAELRNMKQHGVTNPSVYQAYENNTLLYRVLRLREEVGLSKARLFYLGITAGHERYHDHDKLKTSLNNAWGIAERYGYDRMFVYGREELRGEELIEQQAHWAAARSTGVGVFTAAYDGTFERMHKYLDVLIAKSKNYSLKKKVHDEDKLIYTHKPQGGIENPLSYRRNYGFELYATGYDGAMPYAYQHAFGSVWNDFDDKKYRDHNLTYPTVDGVIDTIAWEGIREAIDDVRYITTLSKMISIAPQQYHEIKVFHDAIVKEIKSGSYRPSVVRNRIVDMLESVYLHNGKIK